ncbi:DUF982 domain-containing protein [Rhizobium terrae]|uniref:DUF982 domain-containing protein n=1 Tax=Rhizobium terrae TaxID=2171756 RepID=UPI001D02CC9D
MVSKIAIYGPAEALRYLHENFECRSGDLYWMAVEACNKALRHRDDPEKSRVLFRRLW